MMNHESIYQNGIHLLIHTAAVVAMHILQQIQHKSKSRSTYSNIEQYEYTLYNSVCLDTTAVCSIIKSLTENCLVSRHFDALNYEAHVAQSRIRQQAHHRLTDATGGGRGGDH